MLARPDVLQKCQMRSGRSPTGSVTKSGLVDAARGSSGMCSWLLPANHGSRTYSPPRTAPMSRLRITSPLINAAGKHCRCDLDFCALIALHPWVDDRNAPEQRDVEILRTGSDIDIASLVANFPWNALIILHSKFFCTLCASRGGYDTDWRRTRVDWNECGDRGGGIHTIQGGSRSHSDASHIGESRPKDLNASTFRSGARRYARDARRGSWAIATPDRQINRK